MKTIFELFREHEQDNSYMGADMLKIKSSISGSTYYVYSINYITGEARISDSNENANIMVPIWYTV